MTNACEAEVHTTITLIREGRYCTVVIEGATATEAAAVLAVLETVRHQLAAILRPSVAGAGAKEVGR